MVIFYEKILSDLLNRTKVLQLDLKERNMMIKLYEWYMVDTGVDLWAVD